jgi:hypothetical protein
MGRAARKWPRSVITGTQKRAHCRRCSCGRVALSGLVLPRRSRYRTLRARRVDRAPRQSGFSRLHRFFLRAELDRIGPRAGGFVPRRFSSGCRLELFFLKPPGPTGRDTKVFDRVKAEPEGDRGFESGLLQLRVCEPSVPRAYRGWASRLSVTMRQVITPVAAPGAQRANVARRRPAVLDRRRRRPPQRRRAQIPADPRATSGRRPRKPSCHPFADIVRIAGPPDVKIRNAARAR